MKTAFVEVNQTRMFYKVLGEGDPLLLLHGWTQTSAFWQPYADSLSQHFTLYIPDLPGHGRTGILRHDFSLRIASTDVEMFIRQLNLNNARAIGFSYGGLLLLHLAARNPSLVKQMVVVGVADRYDGRERFKDTPPVDISTLPRDFQEALAKEHPFGDLQIQALFNKDIDYSIILSTDEMKAIQSQVMIVNGDRDEIMGIEGALNLHRFIPGSSLWIIPAAGHMAITETNRNEFLKVVRNFFK